MTTYRCAACNKDVEMEKVPSVAVVEVTPCEACVGVAEEGAKEEGYDKGYQEGWQAGYDTASEEWEEKAEEEEEYGEDTEQKEETKGGFKIDLKLRR